MQYNKYMAVCITDLTIDEINRLVTSIGEPSYRAGQLLAWIYKKAAVSLDEMTDLTLSFRSKLADKITLHNLTTISEVKAGDGTIKMLFRLPDDKTIETALMSYPAGKGKRRFTVCVSTQVGCPVGCPFCATGQQEFDRNLTAGEIIDQVLYFARQLKNDNIKNNDNIDNIVFMGMGEPLANYDNVWQAIEILNSPSAFNLGARSMTVSTAGLIPGIHRMSGEKLQVGLAISLHAPDNRLRNELVPINKKYPIEELIPACRDYFNRTGRRISFEYVLLEGVNDSIRQAGTLSDLIQGMNCHVNLIAANTVANQSYRPSPMDRVLAFQKKLKSRGINCTLRRSRGDKINAGCGQLRSHYHNEKNK